MSSQTEDCVNKCLCTCNCAVFTLYNHRLCINSSHCLLCFSCHCEVLSAHLEMRRSTRLSVHDYYYYYYCLKDISSLLLLQLLLPHLLLLQFMLHDRHAQCTNLQTHAPFSSHIVSTKHEQGNVSKQVPCDLKLCPMH